MGNVGLIQISVMFGLLVTIIYYILVMKWKNLLIIRKIIFSQELQIAIFLGVVVSIGIYFYNIGISRNYTSNEIATLVALLAIMLISLKPPKEKGS